MVLDAVLSHDLTLIFVAIGVCGVFAGFGRSLLLPIVASAAIFVNFAVHVDIFLLTTIMRLAVALIILFIPFRTWQVMSGDAV